MFFVKRIPLGGRAVAMEQVRKALERDLPDYTYSYKSGSPGTPFLRVHVDRFSGIQIMVLSDKIVLSNFVSPWLLFTPIPLFALATLAQPGETVAACIERYLAASDRGECGRKECTQCEASYPEHLTECPDCGHSGFMVKT